MQYKYSTAAEVPVKRLSIILTCRVGCVLLVWLVISLCVPALRRATLLGVIHWKWSLLALLVSLGYPYVYIAAHLSSSLCMDKCIDITHSSYYFAVGLINSVVSLIYVVLVFLVWLLYFHQHQHLAATSPGVDNYTTKTLAMVMVGAFLWVLKSLVLLRWKAKAIYTRFRARILMSGFRFFFLALVLDAQKIETLLPWRYKRAGPYRWAVINDGSKPDACNLQDRIMLSQNASLQQLKEIAIYLTATAKQQPLRDDDKQIFKILDAYRQKIGPDKYVTEEKIRQLVEGDTADFLLEELQAEYPSKELSQLPFENWVVDAHKSYVNVGYMLLDAFAMVKVLNMILTWCIIIAVILLWLLVTELATTKVLVVIGSPFVALTFVFGDTCKTFFQGFIFAFINHPYDIGDRCIIDGVEVEVKCVSIMTTTCLKIGTKEKMLYPNSDLATKLIINLEDKPDPTDLIEVVLDSSTKMSDIYKLQQHIKSFIDNDDQRELFEKSCRVVVKEMGDNIKIIIYFQHTMNIAQDVSQSQFLEKKETQRSKLFSEVKQFLDDLSVKVETS